MLREEGRRINLLKNPNLYTIRQQEVGVLNITDPEMGSWLNCWIGYKKIMIRLV